MQLFCAERQNGTFENKSNFFRLTSLSDSDDTLQSSWASASVSTENFPSEVSILGPPNLKNEI